MGLVTNPEIKLARRIISKYSLKVAFNLDELVKNYATLIYDIIPIQGVDGVSVNLKVPGKKPIIIVNSSLPKTRQLFTLAHELGHIIIPWHIGTIVDEIYSQTHKDILYKEQEQEASRFAAELLMPEEWVLALYKKHKDDLAFLQSKIVRKVGVSEYAAAIRLIETLPPHITYIAEEDGRVLHSGITARTNAIPQIKGSIFNPDLYRYHEKYTANIGPSTTYHWWELSTKVSIDIADDRSWREILNDIIQDIQPEEEVAKFKMSISGIISNAHSIVKRQEYYSIESVTIAAIHKLNRPGLESFVSHPDFEKFIKTRVIDFFRLKN